VEQRRYLRCLGQPALFASTGELIRFRTKKHLALLIYIAVDDRSHRRDRLGELLWPKVSPPEARHSLATALSTLRPRLGPDGLESSRDHVRLAPNRVSLDLERLEAGEVLGSEIIGPLEVAAFLEGFDIPDSAEFTHWKDRQQARLVPMIKDALVVLIDRCRRTGDSRQIERLADRMLALDDLSEEAIRAKMEARAFAGDRLTALEIFEEWKAKLADELQAAPSDLVEGMAVRLRRRGWERTSLPKIPNVPTDQWRGRPFIGRTSEYRVLYEAWEDVRRGIPRHALILGDSGVGKSTLVERLTTAAGLEGAAISRVQCYDLEREIPYSALSTLILGLLDRPGVSAAAPESLAELSRAVPEVGRRFPNIPRPGDSQGETARIRLTEAFHELLTAIAEEHPVILVIDDLHLADDVSLAVIHLVMRRTRGEPIMMVFVARPGELKPSSQAGRLRDSGSTLDIREIELPRLSHQESRELLMSLISTNEERPSLLVERALLRAAAGYPMVLELLVQDWKISGEQSLALSFDSMTAELGVATEVRVPYRQILVRITCTLDPTTHNVLNLASLLGQRLNDLSMYALVDLSVGQTMTAMADLVTRRVLRDGAQGLEFVNEVVRASVYAGVPFTLRKVLHGEIADRFLERQDHGDPSLGLEIAWHCMRAGRVREATCHLMSGARESMRKGAVHGAERALSSAIPHLPVTERGHAALLLAEVLQEQGRWRESLDLLSEVSPEHNPEALLVLTLTATFWVTDSTSEQVWDYVPQLRSVIERSDNISVRIKAAKAMALLAGFLRDARLAKDLMECVDLIPTASLSLDDLASLADAKARLLYNAFERGPCLRELTSIGAELQDRGHVNTTVASLYTGLGAVACGEGRYSDARNEFHRAYEIHARLGNDTYRGTRAAQLALCCFRLGEYTTAVEWSSRAIATFGKQFAGYVECQAAMFTSGSYALRADSEKALQAIAQLESRIPDDVPAWVLQAWGFHKADILFLIGQRSDALAVGRRALGPGTPFLHSWFFGGPFSRWTALTSKGTSRHGEGRECVSHLLDDLHKFDALDQVEILCASSILGCAPERATELRVSMEGKLSRLPPAIAEQLSRLGMFAY
jgi:DNA-binding SARP family transcriptional activator